MAVVPRILRCTTRDYTFIFPTC